MPLEIVAPSWMAAAISCIRIAGAAPSTCRLVKKPYTTATRPSAMAMTTDPFPNPPLPMSGRSRTGGPLNVRGISAAFWLTSATAARPASGAMGIAEAVAVGAVSPSITSTAVPSEPPPIRVAGAVKRLGRGEKRLIIVAPARGRPCAPVRSPKLTGELKAGAARFRHPPAVEQQPVRYVHHRRYVRGERAALGEERGRAAVGESFALPLPRSSMPSMARPSSPVT